MLAVVVLSVGALVLFWTRCVSLQVTTATAPPAPPPAPCLVDDVVAVLREDVGREVELENSTGALFGLCSGSGSVLLQLSEQLRRNQMTPPDVLQLSAAHVSEEDEGGVALTFDLPASPLLKLDSVLLLVLESPITGRELELTFTSDCLQPRQQSVCVSEEAHYILLTVEASKDDGLQKWRISVSTKSSDTKETFKNLFGDAATGRNISMTPLLLFSPETGSSGSRHVPVSASSLQTSFLCELRRFLGSAIPQGPPAAPPVQLDSLRSLPPLMLGSSSSEALLAAVINSSSVTIFSFSSWGAMFPARHGELSLSGALLEELRARLAETTRIIGELIREENVAEGAAPRLERLRELSKLQKKKPPSGERQFFAFLLLKALQTVAHAYEMKKRMRTPRANSGGPVPSVCGLRSLTVSLEKVLVGPDTANINNCHGSCAFPLTNANNHAIQLNSHIESGHASERAPCCVPVTYEGLEVMELNQQGTYISFKPDVIAKECGCR